MQKVQQSIDFLKKQLADIPLSQTALVLGSGLGNTSKQDKLFSVSYNQIPNFPVSTVKGHAGLLCVEKIGGKAVFVLRGRFHLYEGYTAQQVCFPIQVLAGLGIRTLIVTNAAGAINPQFEAGQLMLITDHINLTGHNPLQGPNNEQWGPRFPDMSQVYCPELQKIALKCAAKEGLRLEKGVYVGIMGPSLETPAETRAFRSLGGDGIGMSTVMESIAAHHRGIKVLGISCLTNKNLPDCMAPTSHEEILAQADKAATSLQNLIKSILNSPSIV